MVDGTELARAHAGSARAAEKLAASGRHVAAKTLTMADIQSVIVGESYQRVPGSTFMVCFLTLRNGFIVTGESACADPDAFDQATGEKYARENAVEKIWPLEGYLLRERLSFAAAEARGQDDAVRAPEMPRVPRHDPEAAPASALGGRPHP